MSGHEPEKAGHCLCLLLIRLDNLLQSGGDLPCTTLPCYRLSPRTRASFVVVAAEGGRGVPAISFVCSRDSTSKRALEHARSGATDVPRLLLRQYVQESFGALGGHG